MNYWLMKSEPASFSIDDLERRGRRGEPWDGVRNYQARNMLRDAMRIDDLAFFYHSGCDVPGIAGIMDIASTARPDPAAFDPEDEHHDPGSDPANPRWYLVDVRFRRRLRRLIPLEELRRHKALAGMQLLKRGNRLSVMPVSKAHWDYILKLEKIR
jgi:predicted RNA-binding protein with PUA-like domain